MLKKKIAKRNTRQSIFAPAAAVLTLFLLIAALAISNSLLSGGLLNPGDLDMSFGDSGKAFTDFGLMGDDAASALVLQADGRIVAAGSAEIVDGDLDFALARYHPDGSPDTSFGGGGIAADHMGGLDQALAVAIQPDGKIVAAGTNSADFVLARYEISGTLDASFGTNGVVQTDFAGDADGATSLLLVGDKILVAGTAWLTPTLSFALARYHRDGSPDTAFDGDGRMTVSISGPAGHDIAFDLALQEDGKILVAGEADGDFATIRLWPDGLIDTTFGLHGLAATDFGSLDSAKGIALQRDGKIVVGGHDSFDFVMARYTPNGVLDASFGNGGLVRTSFSSRRDWAEDIYIELDGKILLGGTATMVSEDFALARYLKNGTLDPTFGDGGRMTTDFSLSSDGIRGMAIDEAGRIVAAGYGTRQGQLDFALARYLEGAWPELNEAVYLPLMSKP
jgi:uncharacterized delta-60 repeat protein